MNNYGERGMRMDEQKRLLVLGGGVAAVDVVREAKKLGYYVIATDYLETGEAKKIADKSYNISTTDMDGLKELVISENIDGVFSGPSEFNILNTMRLCEEAKLRFYATREQWDLCSDKIRFKALCKKNNVPVIKEFCIDQMEELEFPIIVKPVDGNSSQGISVCSNVDQVKAAYETAIKHSESKKSIIEKYIDNVGIGVNVRYVAHNKKLHLVLVGDTYTVDPFERTALINAVGIYPSKYTREYIANIDENVKNMFESIGIDHTSLFLQGIYDEGIYFHEMGLRLSGGLLYKLVEPLTNVSDMKMMIRYAVGDEFASEEEINNIDPNMGGKVACIFNVPLKTGKIASIDGLEDIYAKINLETFDKYYNVGDEVLPEKIGTIGQHFGRFKFISESIETVSDTINYIQRTLKIKDQDGADMIYKYFDTSRLL